jgi:hypothetical protein
MNENRSYTVTVKLKDAGVTLHSFACKYYFLIAILKGERRRFEPRPHLKASRQTQLKVFLLSSNDHVFLNGVVVTVLVSCAGAPSSNPLLITFYFT